MTTMSLLILLFSRVSQLSSSSSAFNRSQLLIIFLVPPKLPYPAVNGTTLIQTWLTMLARIISALLPLFFLEPFPSIFPKFLQLLIVMFACLVYLPLVLQALFQTSSNICFILYPHVTLLSFSFRFLHKITMTPKDMFPCRGVSHLNNLIYITVGLTVL